MKDATGPPVSGDQESVHGRDVRGCRTPDSGPVCGSAQGSQVYPDIEHGLTALGRSLSLSSDDGAAARGGDGAPLQTGGGGARSFDMTRPHAVQLLRARAKKDSITPRKAQKTDRSCLSGAAWRRRILPWFHRPWGGTGDMFPFPLLPPFGPLRRYLTICQGPLLPPLDGSSSPSGAR